MFQIHVLDKIGRARALQGTRGAPYRIPLVFAVCESDVFEQLSRRTKVSVCARCRQTLCAPELASQQV